MFAIDFVVSGEPTAGGQRAAGRIHAGRHAGRPGRAHDEDVEPVRQRARHRHRPLRPGRSPPRIIVYAVYARGGHAVAGIALMADRHHLRDDPAGAVLRREDGRSADVLRAAPHVSGYGAMAYVLSLVLLRDEPGALSWSARSSSSRLALLNLLPIPYMTHRGARRMQTHVSCWSLGFLVTPLRRSSSSPATTSSTCCSSGLSATRRQVGFRSIRDEKRRFSRRYRQWATEVSAK